VSVVQPYVQPRWKLALWVLGCVLSGGTLALVAVWVPRLYLVTLTPSSLTQADRVYVEVRGALLRAPPGSSARLEAAGAAASMPGLAARIAGAHAPTHLLTSSPTTLLHSGSSWHESIFAALPPTHPRANPPPMTRAAAGQAQRPVPGAQAHPALRQPRKGGLLEPPLGCFFPALCKYYKACRPG